MKKNIPLFVFGFLMAWAISGSSQIITTVAGNGVNGYSGDGGQASAAEFATPNCVAFDKAGNYYVDDETGCRVREVSNISGIINTVAGNGASGYYGDGGQATSAELSDPIGVVIDSVGNIYIGDLGNFRVRMVNRSTGIITTVAGISYQGYSGDGGQATAAEINNPRYLALDTKGNLYIADAGNNRIRKVITSTGIISTIVGNGTLGFSGDGGSALLAELDYPYGVALDDSNNIYIADQYNNRIREVRQSTNIISTVAGNGVIGFSGDGGQATAAELDYPDALTVANNGDVFISVTQGQTIRKVTRATGLISTFAGNTVAGFYGDGGPATAAELYFPAGITIDPIGNMYVPDWENARVRKITLAETTDVQLLDSKGSVNVYPNPANKELFISFNGISGDISVNIYDMSGRQVFSQINNTSHNILINTASFAIGIYLIKVQTENDSFMRKVEIER